MNKATCPVMEAIAKKLIGIDSVPVGERAKMIKRAAKAGADAVKKQHESPPRGCCNCGAVVAEECDTCKNLSCWRPKE